MDRNMEKEHTTTRTGISISAIGSKIKRTDMASLSLLVGLSTTESGSTTRPPTKEKSSTLTRTNTKVIS